MLNATPYLISFDRFVRFFGTNEWRIELIKKLHGLIISANENGAETVAILVGGSFLDVKTESPKDIDCILFYRDFAGNGAATALRQLWEDAKKASVDIRFIPYDSDPLFVLKACSFFTTLYSRTRTSAEISRGTVLLYMTHQKEHENIHAEV